MARNFKNLIEHLGWVELYAQDSVETCEDMYKKYKKHLWEVDPSRGVYWISSLKVLFEKARKEAERIRRDVEAHVDDR